MDEIAVIGCGAIGLPVAAALAARGARVAGVDVDPAKLARLAQGETELVDAGLAEALRAALTAGRLTFADRLARADGARTYVVATPTPATPDGRYDPGAIQAALAAIGGVACAGDLVCIRSTVPIGTTRAAAAAFAVSGVGFAACPDRSVAGDAYGEQFTVPHLVGGVDADAGARAAAVFARLGAVAQAADAETAEAAKLFANVARDATFAIANQLALIAEAAGVDYAAVRRAGGEGFPRFDPARAGPVGGPCLGKDLALLLDSPGVAAAETGLVRAARAVNEGLAPRTAAAIAAALDAASGPVAILGLAFKGRPATMDRRGAFADALVAALRVSAPAAAVRLWDPADGLGTRRAALADAAVVVLANDHPALAEGIADELARGAIVFDMAGAAPADAPYRVRRLGDGRR